MADTWEALEQACGQCRNCALAETRLHVVFGDGARDAEILLVGEGPGQREDEQGIPFVGPAGLLLDDMLEIIGLDRTKVYVANIVKCRPPRNRDPLNVEQDACIGWLRRQTALLRPKLIVCLGRIAAKAIIKEDFKITAEHGKWFQRGGVQMTAIYHLRAAAGCGEAAGDLCGPESYSGQGAGDLHPHGLLNREALPPGFYLYCKLYFFKVDNYGKPCYTSSRHRRGAI